MIKDIKSHKFARPCVTSSLRVFLLLRQGTPQDVWLVTHVVVETRLISFLVFPRVPFYFYGDHKQVDYLQIVFSIVKTEICFFQTVSLEEYILHQLLFPP